MSDLKPLTPEIAYCRATVKGWERLRLLYNVILLVPGVLVLWRTLYLQDELIEKGLHIVPAYPIAPPLELIALSVIFGFVANICYCLGPYLEFLMTAWGVPLTGRRSRYFSFGMGVMLSLVLIGLAWLYVEYFMVTPFITAP